MSTLLIYGHPARTGFDATLFAGVQKALVAAGHDLRLADACKEKLHSMCKSTWMQLFDMNVLNEDDRKGLLTKVQRRVAKMWVWSRRRSVARSKVFEEQEATRETT